MSVVKNSTAQRERSIAVALAGKERDEKGRIPQIWTEESALEESNKYKNRYDFIRGSNGAYQYLSRKNLLHKLTIPHGKKRHRVDLFEVFCAIKSCKTRGEMQKRFSAEYHATRNHNIAKKVFEDHFPRGKTNKYWNKENAIKEARKYQTRSSFSKHSSGAYEYIKNNRLEDTAFAHMNSITSDFDSVYVWYKKISENLYKVKVGVTSQRLGLERIRFVSKKSGIIPDVVWNAGCSKALRAEEVLKKMGTDAGLEGFSGCTEFYFMNKSQIKRCERIMAWLSKVQESGLINEKENLLRLMQERP